MLFWRGRCIPHMYYLGKWPIVILSSSPVGLKLSFKVALLASSHVKTQDTQLEWHDFAALLIVARPFYSSLLHSHRTQSQKEPFQSQIRMVFWLLARLWPNGCPKENLHGKEFVFLVDLCWKWFQTWCHKCFYFEFRKADAHLVVGYLLKFENRLVIFGFCWNEHFFIRKNVAFSTEDLIILSRNLTMLLRNFQ